MSFRFLSLVFSALAAALVAGAAPDLLIVGGGISGLSAAAEGARLGLQVIVVDRNSLYGGVAVIASGIAIVASPAQEQRGIKDSPELAFQDFVNWGGDPNTGWARYYSEHSKVELFDWFVARGVQFDKIVKANGNSVARFHYPRGGDVSLVQALYREIHRLGGVEFIMNTDVTGLTTENGRVTGVKVRDYRLGIQRAIGARNVLLSTGGFENNQDLVREFWPSQLGKPERILLGSGTQSIGSGLGLARSAGGAVAQLDRQWIYIPGIPLPDDPAGARGVFVNAIGPIWVNAEGKRFINESGDRRAKLEAVTHQSHAKAWMIFDAAFRNRIEIVHPIFNAEPTKSNLMKRPGIQFEAASIEELAEKAGLPPAALAASVERYNQGIESGKDEFGRRIISSGSSNQTSAKPIQTAPFFAIPIYPLTRKSMGGIQVDLSCRVLTDQGKVVPGLYASGEATGFGGVNGKQSLEGTFIGTAILMGRVAARSIAEQSNLAERPKAGNSTQEISVLAKTDATADTACQTCHNLPSLTAESRPGYRHFQLSHKVVMERELSCIGCHAEMTPFQAEAHKINKLAQADTCTACHSPAQ
jgi:flavocytochrome c